MVDQGKVCFPQPKDKKGSKAKVKKKDTKEKPKKLQEPQHEKNKYMSIFNNPFPKTFKAKMKESTIKFVTGFHLIMKKGIKCCSCHYH